jgi:hypothetical protein
MSSTARGGSLYEQVRSTMGTEEAGRIPEFPGHPRGDERPALSREGSFGLVCLSPFVGRPSDIASVRAAVTD